MRPTEDQFNINKMPDRDLCQAHNGATCDAGQIGMIDDDPNTDSNWWRHQMELARSFSL